MEPQLEGKYEELIPPKLKHKHSELNLEASTSYYKIFETKARTNRNNVSIRALDTNSPSSRTNINSSMTLFMQELLYLTVRNGNSKNSVQIQNFEISGKKIGVVTEPQIRVKRELQNPNARQYVSIDRLLQDIPRDIYFLYSRMKLRDIQMDPYTLFYSKQTKGFFLADWTLAVPAISTQQTADINTNEGQEQAEGQGQIGVQNQGPLAGNEIFALGLITVSLCGVPEQDWLQFVLMELTAFQFLLLEKILQKLKILGYSRDVIHKLRGMLQRNASARITMEELLENPPEIDEGTIVQLKVDENPNTNVPFKIAWNLNFSNEIRIKNSENAEIYRGQGATFQAHGNSE